MDLAAANVLAKMGTDLTALAVKGTATLIHSKIESVKNENNAELLRNTYDELVNKILSEREEAIRIAQAYKEELEKIEISDKDIKHLHNTVTRILEIVKAFSSDPEALDGLGQLKELISVDVLKTMQLLGFNYKAAVGEPLTKLCANAISKIGDKQIAGSKKSNGR